MPKQAGDTGQIAWVNSVDTTLATQVATNAAKLNTADLDTATTAIDANAASAYRVQADARQNATIVAGGGQTHAVNPSMSAAAIQSVLTAAAVGSRVVFAPGTYPAPVDGWTVANDGITIDASRAAFTQSTWGRPVFDLNDRDDMIVDVGRGDYIGARSGVGTSYRGSSSYCSGVVVWMNGDRNDIRVRRSVGFVCAVFASAWAGTSTYDRQGVGNRVQLDDIAGYNFGFLWAWQKDLTIVDVFGHNDVDDSAGANPTHVLYGSADATHHDENVTVLSGRARDHLLGHPFQIKFADRLKLPVLTAHNCAGLVNIQSCDDVEWAGGDVTESRATSFQLGAVCFQGVPAPQRPKVGAVRVKLATGVDERGALLIADGGTFDINVVSAHSAATSTSLGDINVRGTGNTVRASNEQLGTATRGIQVGWVDPTTANNSTIIVGSVRGATSMVNVVGGSTGVVIDYDPTRQSVTSFITTTSGTGAETFSTRGTRKAALTTFGEDTAVVLVAATTTCTVGSANSAIQRKVRPTRDITVTGLRWWSTTASGNYDIAIIDDATNVRLWSLGSAVWPAAGVVNETVTGVVLRAGRVYRIAFAADNGTGALRGVTASLAGLDALLDGTTDSTTVGTAFPIPTPLVVGSTASSRTPLVAIIGT